MSEAVDLSKIVVPFGRTSVSLEIPKARMLGIASPRPAKALAQKELQVAIDHPIGAKRLSQIVRPSAHVAIIVDDYTRPTPTAEILQLVVSELKKGGVSLDSIDVIIGGGLHIPTTMEQIPTVVGEELARSLRVFSHECNSPSVLMDLGRSSRGTPIKINRRVVEADFRVSIGLIEPHQRAGFSGGAKSIVPAVSSRETINYNHSMRLPIKEALGKVTGNPVHEDMEEIARKVGVDFIVNVVLNDRKKVVKVVAGDLIAAHRAGVEFARKMMEFVVDKEPEIVVLSPGGHPRDVNLWQTEGKGLTRTWGSLKKGSEIIVISECSQGVGHPELENWLFDSTPEEIRARFRNEEYTLIGEKALNLAELSEYAKLTFYSPGLDRRILSKLPVSFTDNPQKKLEQTLETAPEDSRVLVVPNAPAVLTTVKNGF